MSWDKSYASDTLTADGSGDVLHMNVRSPTEIAVRYQLADNAGKLHSTNEDSPTDPDTFLLSDVAISAATEAAISAHLVSVFGVGAPTSPQIAALHALVVGLRQVDLRSHAATLAGFTSS